MKYFFVLSSTILASILVCACTKKVEKAESTTQSVFLRVRKGKLSGELVWRGVVRSANRIEIRADRKMRIAKVHVNNYDVVKRGQLLIEIDKSETLGKQVETQEKMKSLRLELDAATLKFNHAAKTIERKRPLVEKGIISQREFDEAKRNFSVAETEMKSKKLELDKGTRELAEVEEQLKSSNYYASMEGSVSGLVTVDAGNDIQPGQLLAVVSDPNKLALWIPVEEGSIHRINVGSVMSVTLDTVADQVFLGKVINVGTSSTGANSGRTVATQIKTYEVSVGFNSGKFPVREGFSGSASFTYADKPQTIAIPSAALRYHDGKDVVLAASRDQGDAQPRVVQVGLKTENEVEILSGLSENEYVVIENH